MNLEEHVLDELEVEAFHVKEVLRGLLHTILFTRSLGKLKPVEYVSDVLDLTYARCGVTEMDKQVEEAIENFTHSLKTVGPDLARGTIVLAFFEKRRRYYFGVAKSTEHVYWEQWSIPLIVNHRPRPTGDSEVAALEAERRQSATERAVKKQIRKIVSLAVSRTEHIPPINFQASGPMTFCYEIHTAKRNDSTWNWFSRLMKAEPPKFGD